MKTADLIPLILLELNDCDKYGFELSKNIETKSNGKIIIKQPTLYTILKKLEKSKFISSYWEDSEIGGKRHYYKITENGKMQVSTLPDFNTLVNATINEDEALVSTNESINDEEKEILPEGKSIKNEDNFSIFDVISPAEENNIQPKETILPSSVVFEDNSLDTSTSAEINKDNSKMLVDNEKIEQESFAENENVKKFTEKTNSAPTLIKEKDKKEEEKINIVSLPDEISSPSYEEKIKFVDYVNFSKQPNYIYAKNAVKNMLYRTLSTSGYLIFMLVLCSLIVTKTGGTPLFYFCLISSICVAIFYPIIYLLNAQKFRLKCQNLHYKNNIKKQLIIDSISFVSLLAIFVVVNLISGNSFTSMLSISNFSGFYAPILLSTTLFIDLLYGHIFMSKKLNK